MHSPREILSSSLRGRPGRTRPTRSASARPAGPRRGPGHRRAQVRHLGAWAIARRAEQPVAQARNACAPRAFPSLTAPRDQCGQRQGQGRGPCFRYDSPGQPAGLDLPLASNSSASCKTQQLQSNSGVGCGSACRNYTSLIAKSANASAPPRSFSAALAPSASTGTAGTSGRHVPPREPLRRHTHEVSAKWCALRLHEKCKRKTHHFKPKPNPKVQSGVFCVYRPLHENVTF